MSSNARALAVGLALALTGGVTTSCGSDPPLAPEATFVRELQQALDDALESISGVGVSAAVIMPDGNRWVGVSGVSHEGVSITPDMLFDMGSAGKNLFAALMLKLAEDGLLSLDDSLHEYLPPMPHVDPNITIRQGLNHTSGLYMAVEHPAAPFSQPYDAIDFEKWWTIDEIFTSLMDDPYFPPSEGWHYSQAGYQLGTLIVEQVTGTTVAEAIQSRLLDPLGIHGMLLDLTEPTPANFEIAHNWVDTDGDGSFDDVGDRSRNWINSLSRILYYTRAEDFAMWLHALMQGQVLEQASLDEMLTFVFPNPGEPRVAGYGLGLVEVEPDLVEGQTVWGHGGSIAGYRAFVGHLPGPGITISVLINSDSEEGFGEFITGLLQVILDWASS
jgi:D-alanyl-D-alanine carboxypeptidase